MQYTLKIILHLIYFLLYTIWITKLIYALKNNNSNKNYRNMHLYAEGNEKNVQIQL